MVSLSTFAQYPTTKKIKGEQVVIMSVKQAEDIDIKFQSLKDSIAELTNQLNGCETSLNFTQDKFKTTSNELSIIKDSLEKTNILYEKEVIRQDKLEWKDKFARRRVTFGLSATIMVWIAFIFVTIKN
jgi:hypothetical protein